MTTPPPIRAGAAYVTFATLSTSLGTIDNEDTSTTYDIDVFENDVDAITYDTFLNAFYHDDSEPLNILNHTDANATNELKNLLYLNSGGTSALPRKVINDATLGGKTEYIILSYIIRDIIAASGREYDQWTTDSQISLSRQMTAFNYFSDLKTQGPIQVTSNSLTKTELEKIINSALYLKSLQDKVPLVTGEKCTVSLNIGVIFTFTIAGDSTVTRTQFLYRILVKDFEYSGWAQ